ncbi:diol dehydratase small subunit [Clostridium grantii]|uniref:Propanediol dehydratase small subunit n=1 Tax=Clostridium grantii DSM 8605 TaxID=1121316 RepID=A0A1M5SWQ6_9CLOT|nr:diol dehydratase small subunit [Clostridium grantii]SHH42964.1 propanediol dehydratase small subunit [Clostridium grantii DSM 8605]
MERYPLSQNMDPNKIKSKTGKPVSDITVENILDGSISSEDIKISKETLNIQGRLAAEDGRIQQQQNFTRAAELTEVPDKELLEIYNKLRPNRATKQELLQIANDLKDKYNAVNCANLVLDALKVYEKRGILKV